MIYANTEIQTLLDIYKLSVYTKDHERLISIYDQSVQVFDMWGNGYFNDRDEWATAIRSWLTSLGNERVLVEFADVAIHQETNMAFVHAFVFYKAIAENGHELRKMKNRLTWGLIKKNGTWHVLHQHTSVPITFDTTKAIFDSSVTG